MDKKQNSSGFHEGGNPNSTKFVDRPPKWRYRALFALLFAPALFLAEAAAPDLPVWRNPAILGIVLAYCAGVVAQRYFNHPILGNWGFDSKSFRLLKGADKW